MVIRLESRLKSIQRDLKDQIPLDEIPIKGTLIIPSETFNFSKTDGYIRFMKTALDQIPKTYGLQNEKWLECLNSIYTAAEKLQDENTRFTGRTKEDFSEYCKSISEIKDSRPLGTMTYDVVKSDNLVPALQKHVDVGHITGFYYEETEDVDKEFMNELMMNLSNLKFEKSARQWDISKFLTGAGYHEHVHDALNILIGTAVYAINCSSTRDREAYNFDTQKVVNELEYAKCIMKLAEYLV